MATSFLDTAWALTTVGEYLDAVLRDSARCNSVGLLLNGVHAESGAPLRWSQTDGTQPVLSSLSKQTTLLKTFTIHAQLSGRDDFASVGPRVRQRYFSDYQQSNGLLAWGGHVFVDLERMQVTGPLNKGLQHELKDSFPDYDAMWAEDPAATLRFLRAFWGAHVGEDEGAADFSRHGSLESHHDFDFARYVAVARDKPTPLFSKNLTFMNAANDLIYAALKYFKYTGDAGALASAEMLYGRYVAARHPSTGLGAYLYTIPLQQQTPEDDRLTFSWFGDRAQRQLGPELGPFALEKHVILQNHGNTLYAESPVMLFGLYRDLGTPLTQLCMHAVSSLEAFARHIFVPQVNRCRPVLSDGRDLTQFELARDGYFGLKGSRLQHYPLSGKMLTALFQAGVLFGNRVVYEAAAFAFRSFGLGQLNSDPRRAPQANYATECADPQIVIFLSDAYLLSGQTEFLRLAECVADRMLRRTWYAPYFRSSVAHQLALFDTLEPYALMYLLAVRAGLPVEPYFSSAAAIYGDYLTPAGTTINAFDSLMFKNRVVRSGHSNLQ